MSQNIPYLTRDQMREVDRAMIEDFQIALIQMMENAGRNLAQLARRRFLSGDPRGKSITVLVGTGGNGGGGMVAARHLHNWGGNISVILTKGSVRFRSVPAHQLEVIERMQIPITTVEDGLQSLQSSDLIIDALIGYSLAGAPRGAAAELIAWANEQESPILSLDVPSGIDVTEGAVFTPAILATATMTLALPKEGLRAANAARFVGELYLADISVPPTLYARSPLYITLQSPFAEEMIKKYF